MLHFVTEDRTIEQRDVLGIHVTDFTHREALEFVHGRIAAKAYTPITFLNAHNVNVAMRDAGFRGVLDRFVVLSDGIGVDIAARLLHGRRFQANLNGTDFVPALLQSSRVPLRVGLLGALPGVADRAAERFASLDRRHEFRVIHHGYHEPHEEEEILERLREWKPDVLLVAMGVPKQEKWIAEKLSAEHCTVSMGIGALLDMTSGSIPRAPAWLRAVRSEWVYRLMQEPGRLWRRYLIGNPVFLGRVLRHMLTIRTS